MGLAIKIKVALFDGFFFLQHFFCYFSNSGGKHTILNGIAFRAGESAGVVGYLHFCVESLFFLGNIARYAKK